MLNLKYYFYSILLLSSLTILSCHKHDDDDLSGTGTLEIEFDHKANGQTFAFGQDYVNESGETMQFTEFNYYVSNFLLVKSDGSVYTVPKDECYFLIREKADGVNTKISLSNIPAGDYKEFKFTIGVDSLKSTSPAEQRTGALDPAGEAAGMYWAWNSGYIFVRVEGTSPAAPLDPGTNSNKFRYHIGLFGGMNSPTLNNIRTVSLKDKHDDVAEIRKDHHAAHLHVFVDIMDMFKSPNAISVATNPTVHASPFSANLANNYMDMFVLDHIHN